MVDAIHAKLLSAWSRRKATKVSTSSFSLFRTSLAPGQDATVLPNLVLPDHFTLASTFFPKITSG
jgi:hypothetical protein